MNELYLTEENRECVRRLVRQITPDFEEQLWERARIQLEQLQQLKAAQQASFNAKPYIGSSGGSGLTLGIGAGSVTTVNIYGGGGGGGSGGGSGMYTPVGTGFSTYGPLDANQGLNISKP